MTTHKAFDASPAFLALSSGFIFSNIIGRMNGMFLTVLGVLIGSIGAAAVSFFVGYYANKPGTNPALLDLES